MDATRREFFRRLVSRDTVNSLLGLAAQQVNDVVASVTPKPATPDAAGRALAGMNPKRRTSALDLLEQAFGGMDPPASQRSTQAEAMTQTGPANGPAGE